MAGRYEELTGFRGAVGSVDGTTVVFDKEPARDGAFTAGISFLSCRLLDRLASGPVFFSRKKEYGLQATIVSTLTTCITYTMIGFPASIHDARAYRHTPLSRHPNSFFTPGQYILADSAYTLTDTVLPIHKKPESLVPENAEWDLEHARARVPSEHTMG